MALDRTLRRIALLALALLLTTGCAPGVPAPAPTTGAGAASQSAAADPGPAAPVTGGTPLEDALPSLTPQDVWRNCYDITQVPRPSGHDDRIRGFLVDFGKGLNLETEVDAAGNVLIRRPASTGMEDRRGVVLQAHMDMVGTPRPGTTFDFTTQPIRPYVAGDWVHAGDTTLGADNGIGIAIILALLQRSDVAAPAIEALFTVEQRVRVHQRLGDEHGLVVRAEGADARARRAEGRRRHGGEERLHATLEVEVVVDGLHCRLVRQAVEEAQRSQTRFHCVGGGDGCRDFGGHHRPDVRGHRDPPC